MLLNWLFISSREKNPEVNSLSVRFDLLILMAATQSSELKISIKKLKLRSETQTSGMAPITAPRAATEKEHNYYA